MNANLKKEIMSMSLAELNALSSFVNEVKVLNAKSTLTVGMKVYIVQKTKKTLGTITKVNQKKCLVKTDSAMGTVYTVPMQMLEAA
jgi:RNase P/RNase MRP subunit p29